jgi:hypothetical protein
MMLAHNDTTSANSVAALDKGLPKTYPIEGRSLFTIKLMVRTKKI